MSKTPWLPVLASLLILFSINILMISSMAPSVVFKQMIAWVIGVSLFFIGRQINAKQPKNSWLFLAISCILLVLPIALGNITRGSKRWIDLGFTTFQPSEIAKPLLMLFLANSPWPLLHSLPVVLIMLQPDLGSAISVMFLITPIILYSPKLQKLSLLLFIAFLATSPLIYKYVLHDYQKNRIINFLNPGHDPLGKGYNVIQSKIAVGSGGFWGKGYRKGTQSQLLFLPEKHTDFIFAATAEELGVFGIILILTAYFILLKSLLHKAFMTTNHRPLFLFTLGIVFQIWAQLFINIGMNIGLMPVTGIPLPFLSVGGSSLMALLFSLGIIFSS